MFQTELQSNAIKGDSIKGENFWKIQNELIIFPYITIIERAINRENLRKFQNNFSPLMAFDCIYFQKNNRKYISC